MKREEERKQAAKDKIGPTTVDWTLNYQRFIEGAEWADEHPRKGLVDIEDVCKYLDKYLINDSFNREPFINFVNGECFKETFISHLRKAMEE